MTWRTTSRLNLSPATRMQPAPAVLAVLTVMANWLRAPVAHAAYGAREASGLGLVAFAVLFAAYTVTGSLRFLTLPRGLAVRADSRRWALRLACFNLVASVGLVHEGVRLADAFWFRAAVFSGALASLVLLRWALLRRAAALKPDWNSWRASHARQVRRVRDAQHPSWPEISVTSSVGGTQSWLAQVRPTASVSVDMGSV